MDVINLNPKTTAVVLVDLQRAIVAGKTAPHSTADVVKRSAALAARFRKKGATIVYVHVDIANFVRQIADTPSRPAGSPAPPPSAMEIVQEAGKQPGDLLVTKTSYDAFVHTNLEKTLRDRGVESIVLGGVSTNAGVESTARTAAAMGFALILAEDLTSSSMGEEAHQFAFTKIFPRFARVRKAAELIVE